MGDKYLRPGVFREIGYTEMKVKQILADHSSAIQKICCIKEFLKVFSVIMIAYILF